MKKCRVFIVLTVLLFLVSCTTKTYTITFEDVLFGSIKVLEGDTLILPEGPEIDGHTFEGWFSDIDFDTPFLSSTKVYEDYTLYAKYSVNQYTATFYIDTQEVLIPYDYGDELTYEPIELPGYVFSGWYENTDLTIPNSVSIVTQDISLYGTYIKENEVDIALILDSNTITIHSFSAMLYQGMLTYAAEHNKEISYYGSNDLSPGSFVDASEQAIQDGAKILVYPSFLHSNTVHYLQDKYPNIIFILFENTPHNILNWDTSETYDSQPIDYSINDNTIVVNYDNHELGFLAGYSAVKDGNDYLGFIGGAPVIPIMEMGIGYIAGAYYAANELDIDIIFNDSTFIYEYVFWPDSTLQAKASFMYSIGVDVIFTVTAGGVSSVIDAAFDHNGQVIVPDIKTLGKGDAVLTSVYKRYDLTIYELLEQYYNNSLDLGTSITYGLKEGKITIDFMDDHFSTFEEINVENIIVDISNGSISVPKTYLELISFLGEDGHNFIEETITD